jgi:hypothetical protein
MSGRCFWLFVLSFCVGTYTSGSLKEPCRVNVLSSGGGSGGGLSIYGGFGGGLVSGSSSKSSWSNTGPSAVQWK